MRTTSLKKSVRQRNSAQATHTGTLTVCFFGIYDPQYSRNKILIEGLRENGSIVIECRSERRGIRKYVDLARGLFRIRGSYDILVAAFPAQQSVMLARLFSRTPIIFDPFFSIYDAEVIDRKNITQKSIRAYLLWLTDWVSFRCADRILVDTEAHREYFIRAFGVDREKTVYLPVGADTSIYRPEPPHSKREEFWVHFHGTNIPLQGISTIIEAARLLEKESFKFVLVGSSLTREYASIAPKNVTFHESIAPKQLGMLMHTSDACLGIFGTTPKARRVVPNKVYEAWACGRPVITGDTPAIKEAMRGREAAVLCVPGSALSLTEALRSLKADKGKKTRIGETGRGLVEAYYNPKVIGGTLKKVLTDMLN